MVKHIVLFKLKDEAPADEKLAAMNSFKAAIEALPAKISVIRKIEGIQCAFEVILKGVASILSGFISFFHDVTKHVC